MSDSNNSSTYTFGRFCYDIYWMTNFIYAICVWGGWHIFFNFFVPYALIWDGVTKHLIPWMHK